MSDESEVTFNTPEVINLSARHDHRFDLGKLRRMFASLKDDVSKTKEFLGDLHEDQEDLANMTDYFTRVETRIAKWYRKRAHLCVPDEVSKDRYKHGKMKK